MSDDIRALAIHEAAHAAAIHVLGLQKEAADVVIMARIGGAAATLAGYVGRFHSGKIPAATDIPLENPGAPPAWVKAFESYRTFLPGAVIAWAGPLAQERVSGNRHGDEADMRRVASLANTTLYVSGRCPAAWTRFTRMATRRMLAVPMVWGGVVNLADALAHGLQIEIVKAERSGHEGLVEFMIEAAAAERLLEQGGARRGIFEDLGEVK